MNALDLRLSAFIPGLLVPPEAAPSVTAGFLVLLFVNYTLSSPQWYNVSNNLLRFAIAPIGIYFFCDFGYGNYAAPQAGVDVGMAVICLWGCMRIIDAAIVSAWDPEPPTWIVNGEAQAPPNSVLGRLGWAMDLTLSLRGNSFCKDTHWSFLPKSLIPSTDAKKETRLQFLGRGLVSLSVQYLFVDACDTLVKARFYDRSTPNPITSLPVYWQCIYTPTVLAQTALSITLPYTLIQLSMVGLGAHPENWPPMFDRPFTSSSITEFWSRRWHMMFKRIFERMAVLPVRFLLPPFIPKYARSIIRAVIIFSVSATMHVLLMERVEKRDWQVDNFYPWTFYDTSIYKFFLAQPVGMLVEQLLVLPLIRKIFSRHQTREIAGALWTWLFFLFSGRYWANVWVHRGFWEQRERNVGYSLIRGLLFGRWEVNVMERPTGVWYSY